MTIQSINNNNQNRNSTLYRDVTAQCSSILAGYAANAAVSQTIKSINFPLGLQLTQNARSLNDNENAVLVKAFEKMIQKSGLKDKGIKVNLFNISALNIPEIKERCKKALLLDEQLKSTIKNKTIRDILIGDRIKDPLYSQIVGVNAGYSRFNNIISFADNYVTPAAHEAGHAIINNYKGFGKLIDNARFFITNYKMPQNILLLGLLTRKHENKDGKPLTNWQKAENAIHNNLGFIVGGLSIPCIINEAQASQIAEKYMKPVLPKNLYKKVVKNNRLGLSTYVISAIATGCGAAGAVKIKDKVFEKVNQYFNTPKKAN